MVQYALRTYCTISPSSILYNSKLYIFDIDSYYSFVYTVLVRYIQITKIIYQIIRVFRKMVSFMEIILTNTSTKPIYEQITSQIKEMILKGELKPGDPMPSMRKLAKDLHVSVITTQRARSEEHTSELQSR